MVFSERLSTWYASKSLLRFVHLRFRMMISWAPRVRMKPLVHLPPPLPKSPFSLRRGHPPRRASPRLSARFSLHRESMVADDATSRGEYKPGVFDDLFLGLFRSKMVKEVGWDSGKPGYDGLIEVAHRLMMKGSSNSDTSDAAVRILRSLFPPFLPKLYRMLIAPIGEGKLAAVMVARVTTITCQWLMGKCMVNSVDLPDGTSCKSGVFVEKCKYLEESKCVGICINTCKLPTQSFFKDYMGVPLLMEPNFEDYSCQFKFGIHPPGPQDDAALKEPCLEICPNAIRRKEVMRNTELGQCPKA